MATKTSPSNNGNNSFKKRFTSKIQEDKNKVNSCFPRGFVVALYRYSPLLISLLFSFICFFASRNVQQEILLRFLINFLDLYGKKWKA